MRGYQVTVAVLDKEPVKAFHPGRAAAVNRACMAYWALSVGLCPEEDSEPVDNHETFRFFDGIKWPSTQRLTRSPRNRAFAVTLEKVD